MKDGELPPGIAALLAGSVEGVTDEELGAFYEMMESGPGEGAGEEEIEKFMEKVLATEAGRKIVAGFSENLPRESSDETPYSAPASVARMMFRVRLLGTKPEIWRRLSLAADATFFDLHCAVQDSFGWLNTGAHEFQIRDEGRVELPVCAHPRGDDQFSERELMMADLISNGVSEFVYRYDFEANWEHLIQVEGAAGISRETGPQIHEGSGLCPLEGCGGVEGFKKFLSGDHPMVQEYGPELVARIREGEFDPGSVRFRDPSEMT